MDTKKELAQRLRAARGHRGLIQAEIGRALLPSAHARPEGSSAGIDETILQMGRVIAERFDPRLVILFGSHARGAAGPDSDVDLLVVMDVEGSKRRTAAKIGAALHGFALPKDVIVTTPEAFRSRREVPGTIERSAVLEGKVLFSPQQS